MLNSVPLLAAPAIAGLLPERIPNPASPSTEPVAELFAAFSAPILPPGVTLPRASDVAASVAPRIIQAVAPAIGDLAGLLAGLDPTVRSGVESLLKDLIGHTADFLSGRADTNSLCSAATIYFRSVNRMKPGRKYQSPPTYDTPMPKAVGRAAEGLRLGKLLRELVGLEMKPRGPMVTSGLYRYHLHPGTETDGLIVETKSYDSRSWIASKPAHTSLEVEQAKAWLMQKYNEGRPRRDPAAKVISPTATKIEFGDAPTGGFSDRVTRAAQQSIDEMNAEVSAAFWSKVGEVNRVQ